jgi:hypothetical protein
MIMTRWLAGFIVMVGLSGALSGDATAEEQRCKDLGANCVCSEPLNTATLNRVGDAWYDPGDTTTKQCSMTEYPNAAVERPALDLVVASQSTDPTMFAALPAGHILTRILRGPNNHSGIFSVGTYSQLANKFVKRVAFRFYVYHSPDYEFQYDGACLNSKLLEFSGDLRFDKAWGAVHTYNFMKFSPSRDCCVNGPGGDGNTSRESWRGKWWRVEAVAVNRDGPGFRLQGFLKNITDKGQEFKVVDTAVATSEWPAPTNLTPPTRMNQFSANLFRNGSPCRGYNAITHVIVAGWDTDAGQRIGTAVEVEGGGGGGGSTVDTTPPSTPPGVTVR